jgi:hypothetical protein
MGVHKKHGCDMHNKTWVGHVQQNMCDMHNKIHLGHVEVINKDDHLLALRRPVYPTLALVHFAINDFLHSKAR